MAGAHVEQLSILADVSDDPDNITGLKGRLVSRPGETHSLPPKGKEVRLLDTRQTNRGVLREEVMKGGGTALCGTYD